MTQAIKLYYSVYHYLLGILVTLLTLAYLLFCSPIFLYRLFVFNIVAPYFRNSYCHPVSVGGQGCATDFIKEHISSSHRSAVVINMTFEGNINRNDFIEKVWRGWINKRDSTGNLMYPELKCYITNFMGFMFWKQNTNFMLENHVTFHDIGANSTENISKHFVYTLMKRLLNTPFKAKRSPWEFHLIHNYKNKALSNGTMSVLLTKIHHSMVDGPSFMIAMGTGLLDQQLEKLDMVYKTGGFKNKGKYHLLKKIIFKVPDIIKSAGYLFSLCLQRNSKTFMVPDAEKTLHQRIALSKMMRVEDLKRIKRKHGVSFMAVLLYGISTGISTLQNKYGTHKKKSFSIPVGIPVPIWKNHKHLGVYSTGTVIELPIPEDFVEPREHLLICQNLLNAVKSSSHHMAMSVYITLFFSNIANLARWFAFNSVCPLYITNVPTPSNDLYFLNKHKVLTYDYVVGGMLGNAGMGFIVPSYKNNIKFVATAEAALVTSKELSYVIAGIQESINKL